MFDALLENVACTFRHHSSFIMIHQLQKHANMQHLANHLGRERAIGAGQHVPQSSCASWHLCCGQLQHSTSRCAWGASPNLQGIAQQTCRSHSSCGTWSSCRSHNQSWGKGWNPWIVCAHGHRCLWACARLGSCAWSDQPGSEWTSSFASSQFFSYPLASAWLPWNPNPLSTTQTALAPKSTEPFAEKNPSMNMPHTFFAVSEPTRATCSKFQALDLFFECTKP